MATALDFMKLLNDERKHLIRNEKKKKKKKTRDDLSRNSVMIDTKNIKTGRTTTKKFNDIRRRPSKEKEFVYVSLSKRPRLVMETYTVSGSLSDCLFYIPNFINEKEEIDILKAVDRLEWIDLRTRRLQNHGGTPQADGFKEEPLPDCLDQLSKGMVEAGIFQKRPNHVLVNNYVPGQGIAPHQDGPLYEPLVAIVTLAGSARLDFYDTLKSTKDGEPTSSVLCLPRSLLIFRGRAYRNYWHGISKEIVDEVASHTGNASQGLGMDDDNGPVRYVPRGDRRVSLTIRRVSNAWNEKSRKKSVVCTEEVNAN